MWPGTRPRRRRRKKTYGALARSQRPGGGAAGHGKGTCGWRPAASDGRPGRLAARAGRPRAIATHQGRSHAWAHLLRRRCGGRLGVLPAVAFTAGRHGARVGPGGTEVGARRVGRAPLSVRTRRTVAPRGAAGRSRALVRARLARTAGACLRAACSCRHNVLTSGQSYQLCNSF